MCSENEVIHNYDSAAPRQSIMHHHSKTHIMSCAYTVSSQVIIGTSTAAVCVVVTLLVIVATIGVVKLHRKVREMYMNVKQMTTKHKE